MAAPFRITRPPAGLGAASNPEQDLKDYLERLLKMIPAEVIGLYLVGSGLIPKDQPIGLMIWSIVCLFAVVIIRAVGTADPKQGIPTSWTQVLISSVAFVIWLYGMGGPFISYGIHVPYIGSLMVLAWSFFVPYIYRGAAT